MADPNFVWVANTNFSSIYELIRIFANRKWRHADFSARGVVFVIFCDGFGKANPNFVLVFDNNFSSIYNRFWDNQNF
jgi:hypothetical protein